MRGVSETADDQTDSAEQVWEIRFSVHCTADQARDIVDRIQVLLCPDPLHEGPCPIPWSSAHWPLEDEEAAEKYPTLLEQVRIERGSR